MKKVDYLTNREKVSKTLKFRAIPVGETEENIKLNQILESDFLRNDNYKKATKLMDEYHKSFINEVLSDVRLEGLADYADLYYKKEKTDKDKKDLLNLAKEYRSVISKAFKANDNYNSLFKENVLNLVTKTLSNEEDVNVLSYFDNFSAIFRKTYFKNRENLYAPDDKASSIANRTINENLPRFLDNVSTFKKMQDIFEVEQITKLEETVLGNDYYVTDFFNIDFYSNLLTQEGIDIYNSLIGGVSLEGEKIQGLNEYINLYNQKFDKKTPKLKKLHKQLLSDSNSTSFKYEPILNKIELIAEISSVLAPNSPILASIDALREMLASINTFDLNGIYIRNNGILTSLSNEAYGAFYIIKENWNKAYDANSTVKNKTTDKYITKRENTFKKINYFSLAEIIELCEDNGDLSSIIKDKVNVLFNEYQANYQEAKKLLTSATIDNITTDAYTETIKNCLDSIKAFEKFVKAFDTDVEIKNEYFYGQYTENLDTLKLIDAKYNRIRNYFTKKPYNTDKINLFFNNASLLAGWDINKEQANTCALLRKDGNYYLAVINTNDKKCLMDIEPSSDNYEKMIYKQIPNAAKYICPKQFSSCNPSARILKIYAKKKAKSPLTKKELTDFLDFCINDFLANYSPIIDKNGNNYFNFKFKKPNEYSSLEEFFDDVDHQGYATRFEPISKEAVDKLVKEGKIYLFRLYNKDFSDKSHGKENLHTMYFKALFDENNKFNVRLNGEGNMYFRPASLDINKVPKHDANKPMNNKNSLNNKKTTTLPYTLYKDKRYTKNQYEVHLPITFNKIPQNDIKLNDTVRDLLKKDKTPYIIGIDRGERNLLYVCVINHKGEIVEQYSLNEIINKCNDTTYVTNYHDLLDNKEKDRYLARQDWKRIENIKELKEGYLSQVVHIICQLVEKYDAVISLEFLNNGFKNSRMKIEKNVYQKFETMLISKLNYMVNKDTDITKAGGVLNGYQLTMAECKSDYQNGFVFYIPADYTSKIDPTTGFVNLFSFHQMKLNDAIEFFNKFDKIYYDKKRDMFGFSFNYKNFPRADFDFKKQWTVYTNGERIRTFRKKANKGFEYDAHYNPTNELKALFDEYNIVYNKGNNLQEEIASVNKKDFYDRLSYILRLTLQMRNSMPNSDIDYLISPVLNKKGKFYNSNECSDKLPLDADANGAYNIARKALWAINKIKADKEGKFVKTSATKAEWFEFAQTNVIV